MPRRKKVNNVLTPEEEEECKNLFKDEKYEKLEKNISNFLTSVIFGYDPPGYDPLDPLGDKEDGEEDEED